MRTDNVLKGLGMLSTGGILALFLHSCDSKFYEDCPPDRIVKEWGVMNHSRTFGEYDSLYYVVNPIGNVNDTVYYNGDYTDSYYHSDPVRIMMKYTPSDSIYFNLDRLYVTQTNPREVVMTVKDATDSLKLDCKLHLRRGENNENLYSCGPDSMFKTLLEKSPELLITATNGASSSEPQGSQNYEVRLYTDGFKTALNMADSLNKALKAKAAPREATDACKDTKGKKTGNKPATKQHKLRL